MQTNGPAPRRRLLIANFCGFPSPSLTASHRKARAGGRLHRRGSQGAVPFLPSPPRNVG
jgi:hypothetical protein